uniref:Small ribosomal subunit protein mS25 n=1 Tax=Clastoptera arizonana TaxID=38151 RepID=A0A1B6CTH5_9HEMI
MPFMIGPAPIRRTLKYLEAGKIIFKDALQIFSINYNTYGDHHKGTRDFVFWHLGQLQYKNPNVQIISLKNMTPSPFVRCYFDDGKEMLIDLDSKGRDEIFQHLMKVLSKPEEVLNAESKAREQKQNPAHFGYGCEKHCICEIPGQVPCPGVVPLPNHMRGKTKNTQD